MCVVSSPAPVVVPRGQPGDDSRRCHWQESYDALLSAYASRLGGMATLSVSGEGDTDGIQGYKPHARGYFSPRQFRMLLRGYVTVL